MEVENDNEAVMAKYYFGITEVQETSEGTRAINHIGIGTGLLAMHVTNPDGSTEIVQCFTDRLGSPIVFKLVLFSIWQQSQLLLTIPLIKVFEL